MVHLTPPVGALFEKIAQAWRVGCDGEGKPREGAVESPAGFGRVEVSHIGLNDQVVEGLRALDIPAFSVQYHPEAAAGPHDSTYLFDRFRAMVIAAQTPKDSQ